MIHLTCKKCGKGFSVPKPKFCSKACWSVRNPPITKKCLSCGEDFVSPPHEQAKFCSLACRNKDYRLRVGKQANGWKGGSVSYSGLHYWVRRHRGKPVICEHCGKSDKKLQWANKSGKYLRELSDWLSLCISCHRFYDNKQRKKHLSPPN